MKNKFFTMRKKVLLVVICFFCLFALCGCGSVNYSVIISNKGEITLQLDLKFDAQKLTTNLNSANKNLSDFASKVQSYATAVYNNSYADFEDKLYEVAKDNVVEVYGNQEWTTQQVKQYVLSNIKFSNGSGTWSQKNNTISCVIFLKFETYNAYRYFNGIYPSTEDEPDEDVKEERKDNFFFAEDYTYTKSVYNDIEHSSFAQYFLQYFNNNLTVDDMNYQFTYSTPSTKMYSNAHEITTDSETGNIVHTWKFSANDLKSDDYRICTYEVKIRAWVWYVMAVTISVLVGIVLFVIVKVKETKQKKLLIANMQNFEKTSE